MIFYEEEWVLRAIQEVGNEIIILIYSFGDITRITEFHKYNWIIFQLNFLKYFDPKIIFRKIILFFIIITSNPNGTDDIAKN